MDALVDADAFSPQAGRPIARPTLYHVGKWAAWARAGGVIRRRGAVLQGFVEPRGCYGAAGGDID
jgi:hypothetical protein